MTTYDYQKVVNVRTLTKEIEDSSIVTVLTSIDLISPDLLFINFESDLSASDETTLDSIVAAHINQPFEFEEGITLRQDAWEQMLGRLRHLTRPGGPHGSITNAERRDFIWAIIQTQHHDGYMFANRRPPLINFIDNYDATNAKFNQALQNKLIAIIDF